MSKRRRKLTVEKWVDAGEVTGKLARSGMSDQEFVSMITEAVDDGMISEETLSWHCAEQAIRMKFLDSGMQAYMFDRDFFGSIAEENWDDLLPDVVRRVPCECFYMHLPYGEHSSGIVIWLRDMSDVDTFFAGDEQLRFFEMAKQGGKGVYYGEDTEYDNTFVNDGETVWCISTQAIPREIDMMFDDVDYGVYPNRLIVNGISYLCSRNADINKVYEPTKERGSKSSRRYSAATWHEVGYRVGSELRRYRHSYNGNAVHRGGRVRPHMRRAHWHHYWTGPMDGDRQLVLKWIPPILVASRSGNVNGITCHRVPTEAKQ